MTSPLPLPDWVPWWVHLVVLLVALLFGLAFLFMPFSVFGVKARLEGVEARLDEIQGELRSLALRMPGDLRAGSGHGLYVVPETQLQERGPLVVRPGRTEPRLY